MKRFISLHLALVLLLSSLSTLGPISVAYAQDQSNCEDGQCLEKIVGRLEDLGNLYEKQCLPSERPKDLQKHYEENGLTEACWKIMLEISELESELSTKQNFLEAKLGCESGDCKMPDQSLSLNSKLAELNLVVQDLACTEPKKQEIKKQCPDDLQCALAASALGIGGHVAELLVPQNFKPASCHLGDDSCATQFATGFLKAGVAFLKDSWGLLTKAGNKIKEKAGDFWVWVTGAEDHSSTTQLAMAKASEDPGVFEQLKNDFPGTMKNIWAAFVGMMKEWMKKDVFCQKWSGVPHLSECLQPTESFDCISCKAMLNSMCSIPGTITAEVVPAFLTGGLITAAKYGASGATKLAMMVKISAAGISAVKNSKVGKLAVEASTKVDEALKISKGLKATKTAITAALAVAKKYLLSPTRKAVKESFAVLSGAVKKGALYVAKTPAEKVLIFGGITLKTTGKVLLYPIDNPMTTFAFKAGEKSFDKIFRYGAAKLAFKSTVTSKVVAHAEGLEPLLVKIEEAKKAHVNPEELTKLEEELLGKIKDSRRNLVNEILTDEKADFSEILETLYPELQYGDLAKKVGSRKVLDSENELLLHLEAMPSGLKKDALLKRYQAHIMQGEARAKIVAESSVKTDSPVGLIGSLEDASFAQDKFTKNILESFREKGSSEASLLVFKKTKREIIEELKSFKFQNKSGTIVEMRPDVFVGAAHGSTEEVLNLAGSFHAVGNDSPIGFFVLSFPKGQSGKIQPYLEMIKVDTAKPEIKGLAAKLIPAISDQLQKSGYSRLDLEADWMGRLVWAKNGFDFDPDIMFVRGGEKISQLDLARENLKRFLDAHKLKITDLEIKSASGNRAVSSFEDLKTPLDFIDLIHAQGRKITIKPYVGEGVFEEASEQSVGSAFALTDYSPRQDQSLKIMGPNMYPLSDQALFNWQGVLRLHPK